MTRPTNEPEADEWARAWIDAWNSHDLDRIVAHYRDDIEYESPFVARISPGNSRLSGGDAVRDYVAGALERFPDLHFGEPQLVALGADSVAIVYRSVNDLVAVETLVLDGDGLVVRALCHYRAAGG
jgi:ketosteroid isomerase-like protein